MEVIFVKLQVYKVYRVQTGYLLQKDFATDSFRKMFRKLVALEEHFEKVYVVTAF